LIRLENTLLETSNPTNMASLTGLPELHCGDHKYDINRIFYFKFYSSFLNKNNQENFKKKINLNDKEIILKTHE